VGSESLHEPAETLNADTVDTHRGVASLLEELDAIDWYNQRVDATGDSELVGILEHNRDEEKEHAAMLLEWLRRRDPNLDAVLRRYLFTERPILEIEDLHPDRRDEATNAASGGSPSLAIGGLQDKELL
jgi:ferritin-like protein